ncbi:hypothetical protein MTO96_041768 [Rhipicephalus appendiculatus]
MEPRCARQPSECMERVPSRRVVVLVVMATEVPPAAAAAPSQNGAVVVPHVGRVAVATVAPPMRSHVSVTTLCLQSHVSVDNACVLLDTCQPPRRNGARTATLEP